MAVYTVVRLHMGAVEGDTYSLQYEEIVQEFPTPGNRYARIYAVRRRDELNDKETDGDIIYDVRGKDGEFIDA